MRQARTDFGERVGNRPEAVGRAVEVLVQKMLARVYALLDAGANDSADPLVRKSEFAGTATASPSPYVKLLYGYVRGMRPNSPLADVEPLLTLVNGERAWLLGHPDQVYFRKSHVQRLTGEANLRAREEQAERERIAAIEVAERDAMYWASPEGQRRKIRELEAQLKALQAQGATQPTG